MAKRTSSSKAAIRRSSKAKVLMLTAICEHDVIGQSLARKVIKSVKDRTRTLEEAVSYLSCLCTCGNFDEQRARCILEEARDEIP